MAGSSHLAADAIHRQPGSRKADDFTISIDRLIAAMSGGQRASKDAPARMA
jgi:hypothetical protein